MLLLANAELSQGDIESIKEVIVRRLGPAKVITVKGNARAVIVKTTNLAAPLLRGEDSGVQVGGKKLVSTLTSGAIGNLKKRASEVAANGKVP